MPALYLSKVLRPGARLACAMGGRASCLRAMIRTAKLLAELAGSLLQEFR